MRIICHFISFPSAVDTTTEGKKVRKGFGGSIAMYCPKGIDQAVDLKSTRGNHAADFPVHNSPLYKITLLKPAYIISQYPAALMRQLSADTSPFCACPFGNCQMLTSGSNV